MTLALNTVLFFIAVPIAIETLGTLFALRDGWCDRAGLPSAINRVAWRLVFVAAFLAIAPQASWWVLLAASAVVLFAHVATFFGFRVISRRYPARVIDRDG